MNNMIVEVG